MMGEAWENLRADMYKAQKHPHLHKENVRENP